MYLPDEIRLKSCAVYAVSGGNIWPKSANKALIDAIYY
jgi:hypothetical protein